MMKGRYGRDIQSDSSASECGHLELWVIDLVSKAVFARTFNPAADRKKVSALKLRHPTPPRRNPVLERQWFFVNYNAISEGKGEGLYSNLYGMRMEIQPFKDFLGARGFRSTREREIILKELETRKDHFNAEKLYSILNRKGTRVSRPTIYRMLKLLEQSHLIERLDIKKNWFYYEPKYQKKDHGHLICEQCGKIIDFSCGGLENLKSEVSKERDFKTDNVSIHVFGICGTCQKAS